MLEHRINIFILCIFDEQSCVTNLKRFVCHAPDAISRLSSDAIRDIVWVVWLDLPLLTLVTGLSKDTFIIPGNIILGIKY